MTTSTPLTVRGVTYPSRRAAAAALGVSHATVLTACARGTVDGIGLRGRDPSPVTIRGVTYADLYTAAGALGVAYSTAAKARRDGRLDQLGLGTGAQPCMSIKIRGVHYPNVAAAAKALKVSKSAVFSALQRGRIDRLGLGVDYKSRRNPGGKKKPITIGGKQFPSIADLARYIGRPPASVVASLRAGDVANANIARAVLERNARDEAKARAEREAAMREPKMPPQRRAANVQAQPETEISMGEAA